METSPKKDGNIPPKRNKNRFKKYSEKIKR